jgi:hypothetical protein
MSRVAAFSLFFSKVKEDKVGGVPERLAAE